VLPEAKIAPIQPVGYTRLLGRSSVFVHLGEIFSRLWLPRPTVFEFEQHMSVRVYRSPHATYERNGTLMPFGVWNAASRAMMSRITACWVGAGAAL